MATLCFIRDMEITKLSELIKKKLNENGYDLYELSLDHKKILHIVIDRVEDINMTDIVNVTDILNPYLDEIDPFDFSYSLDISSLGVEKPLQIEKLISYVNRYVHINLINPIEGENVYEGNLDAVNENDISISFKVKTRTKKVDILKSNISKIRLAVKF